jgi:F420-non-reducing hydrogenase iron-sulfur subunit
MAAHVAAGEAAASRGGTGEGLAPEGAWKPRVIAFFCNWCTYTAADLAGVSRLKHSPYFRIIRVMCSGRVDPQFVLEAFARGADAVLIGGCHPGDCHYIDGNTKCLRRTHLLKRMLAQVGIEPERLRLEWISASEGDRVKTVVNELVATVEKLGPLGISASLDGLDREVCGNGHGAGDAVETDLGAGAPGAPEREEAVSHVR